MERRNGNVQRSRSRELQPPNQRRQSPTLCSVRTASQLLWLERGGRERERRHRTVGEGERALYTHRFTLPPSVRGGSEVGWGIELRVISHSSSPPSLLLQVCACVRASVRSGTCQPHTAVIQADLLLLSSSVSVFQSAVVPPSSLPVRLLARHYLTFEYRKRWWKREGEAKRERRKEREKRRERRDRKR